MDKKLQSKKPAPIMVSDRVTFRRGNREQFGYVCRKGRTYAHVLCDDRSEVRVPYAALVKIPGVAQKTVQSHSDAVRAQFHVNDHVRFDFRGSLMTGILSRLNPKQAHIVCENGREFRVPYVWLTLVSRSEEPHAAGSPRSAAEIDAVAAHARELMTQHGLLGWSFQFDHGRRRAGCCQYQTQVISLSSEYAKYDSDAGVEDTILHEIAHALAGKEHHHDAIWRAQAIRIGCSGKRCHTLQFVPPRYIVRCVHDCWVSTAETRRQGRVCRKCRGKLEYVTYTAERFIKEQARIAAR
ncbi:MAG: SprT-like domain-containing protein [Candidatus Latescibacterota bacterium]